MKKLLIISPTPSHPQNAGNRARIFSFVEEVKKNGIEVHFLYVNMEGDPCKKMVDYWGDFLNVFSPSKSMGSNISHKLYEKVLHKLKLWNHEQYIYNFKIDDCFDDEIVELCKLLHDKNKFTHVLVEYVFFSKALTAFGGDVKKMIDTHDRFADRYKIFPIIDGKRYSKWFSTYKNEEKKGLRRADIIIAIQSKEAKYFSKLVNRPVVTIGHFFENNVRLSTSENNKVLFFASGNSINIDGYCFLTEQIWPLIHKKNPESELVIAGLICNEVNKYEGITYLGNIDNKEDAYRGAKVVINPMRFGSGLKIKTIEALLYGIPVVSTEEGAIGFDEMREKCIFVSDDLTIFAKYVNRLLNDKTAFTTACLNIGFELERYRDNNIAKIKELFK